MRVQTLIRVELSAAWLWLSHYLIKWVLLRFVRVMIRVHQACLLPFRSVDGLILTHLDRVQIHLIHQIFIEHLGLIRWPLWLGQNILPHFDLVRQFGTSQARCSCFGLEGSTARLLRQYRRVVVILLAEFDSYRLNRRIVWLLICMFIKALIWTFLVVEFLPHD